jgi:hypothetical protein
MERRLRTRISWGGFVSFVFSSLVAERIDRPFEGYYDPQDPYNNNAYPNSWTPPLNKTWNFNTDRIFGYVILVSTESITQTFVKRQSRWLVCVGTVHFSRFLPEISTVERRVDT